MQVAIDPVVTTGVASQLANVSTVTIAGFGFDPTPGKNIVLFNDGAGDERDPAS